MPVGFRRRLRRPFSTVCLVFPLVQVPLTDEDQQVWPVDRWEALNLERSKAAFDQLAWVTERLSLPDQVKEWNWPQDGAGKQIKVCSCCAPPLPSMRWVYHNGKLTAREDPQQAADYESRIKVRAADAARPAPAGANGRVVAY